MDAKSVEYLQFILNVTCGNVSLQNLWMSAVFPTAASPTVTTVTSGALATLPLSLPAICFTIQSSLRQVSVTFLSSLLDQLPSIQSTGRVTTNTSGCPSVTKFTQKAHQPGDMSLENHLQGLLEREIEEHSLPLPPSQRAPVDCTSPRCPQLLAQPHSSLSSTCTEYPLCPSSPLLISATPLGKPLPTKTDEFSEKFQTAVEFGKYDITSS